MTARLPVVGQDGNAWGTLLNEYLLVGHNTDGTNIGSGGGLPTAWVDLADYVTDFTGVTDQRTNVLAALNALPSTGGVVWHPGGKVGLGSTVALASYYVTFLGPLGGMDSQDTKGAWFVPTTSGITLFSCDLVSPGTLRQTGPNFQNIGFLDTKGSCVMLYTRDTNRVRLKDCIFSGFGSAGTHTTIGWRSDISAGGRDSSWHTIEDTNFRSCLVGMDVIKTNGFHMRGGLFSASYECKGLDLQSGAATFFNGVNGNGCNPCFNLRSQAYLSHWSDCYWETTANDQPYQGWKFDGGGTGTDGYAHTVIGCHAVGNGSNSKGIELTSAAHQCRVMARTQNCGAGGIINSSTDSMVDDLGPANGYISSIRLGVAATATNVFITRNAGTPEASITAGIGSLCLDTTNGNLYIKASGVGNTNWKLVTRAA